MPETLLLLGRHAETMDNIAVRLSGWTDGDLSPRGEQQVRLLADHFNGAHGHAAAIYASPLTRARRTAEAIGALTGHSPIFDPDLREMHFGELEGSSLEEIKERHAELLAGDEDPDDHGFGWPGGETRAEFVERVLGAMDRAALTHPGAHVAAVRIGGVISTFLARLHAQPAAAWRGWLVGNASLTEVSWDGAARVGRLLRRGDDAHLAALTDLEAPL